MGGGGGGRPGKFIIPLNVRRRVVQCECDCQF